MSKNDERGEHHVALWLANDYGSYCFMHDLLKETRKTGVAKALGVRSVSKAIVKQFKNARADGFKYTLSRVEAYISNEWDEMDLQESNRATRD